MTGSSLAHYEITGLLGRGGMGEVHRARDTKLGREVALKFLPDDLAADPERLARFRREAKVLASLHHPNIAGIFGLEDVDHRTFLVMELAEGADLSERIRQGPIPEEDVIDIARQLAAGLEAAHESGVVHRDLKPANIKLGSDGKVRILDFGLARAYVGETSAEESLENSPTMTAAMSRAGMILGTAAYMSPEQARGRKVDRRADIWSFGVVLFEMLTGRRLFDGETVSDTLAAVLRQEVEWSALPPETSPGMRRLLERCLERDPLRRLRDIGEARVFLENGAKDSSILASASSLIAGVDAPDAAARRGLPLPVLLGAAVLLVAAGAMIGKLLPGGREQQLFNMTLPAPVGGYFNLISTRPGPPSISPDGTMVVYVARDAAGTTRLALRRLDSPEETILSGTERSCYPFWSPDSRYIGFGTTDGKLRKVAVAGGPPVTLCAAENLKGGTWNRDGVILFAPSHNTGLFRVSASGGEPVTVTTVGGEGGQNSHRHPRFLPGGKQFLYLGRTGGQEENEIFMGSLNGDPPRKVTTSEAGAEFSGGHLLTVREGILLASPFDIGKGTPGDGVPLAENILLDKGGAWAAFSSTADGMLVYKVSTGSSERALEWLGSADAKAGRIGDPGQIERPRISPDGTRAIVEITDPDTDGSDLWMVELETGLRSRFTFEPGSELSAVWSTDGREVLYVSRQDSTERIVSRPVEGTGGVSVLHEGKGRTVASGMTPDGRTLMLCREDPETAMNLYSLALDTGKLDFVLETDASEFWSVVSPDGRWMAYNRTAGSGFEVIVRPMSGGDRVWQVDQGGGLYPLWGPDGNTLFYLTVTGDIMAVPVDGSGPTFRAGAPVPHAKVGAPEPEGPHISLHPDGKRILHVNGGASEDESGYLRLVTDWRRGLAN